MVLTACNALSWVNGLSCHPRLRDANITAGLIPAARDQDHTPWLVRPGPFVGLRHARARSQDVHRIPQPTSVTTAKRPSCGDGMHRTYHELLKKGNRKLRRESRNQAIRLMRLAKFRWRAMRFVTGFA